MILAQRIARWEAKLLAQNLARWEAKSWHRILTRLQANHQRLTLAWVVHDFTKYTHYNGYVWTRTNTQVPACILYTYTLYTHTHLNVYVCTRTNTQVPACILYTHTHYIHIHVIYTYTLKRRCMHSQTHIHTHTHTGSSLYTRVGSRSSCRAGRSGQLLRRPLRALQLLLWLCLAVCFTPQGCVCGLQRGTGVPVANCFTHTAADFLAVPICGVHVTEIPIYCPPTTPQQLSLSLYFFLSPNNNPRQPSTPWANGQLS